MVYLLKKGFSHLLSKKNFIYFPFQKQNKNLDIPEDCTGADAVAAELGNTSHDLFDQIAI